MKEKILIVLSDPTLVATLSTRLVKEGYLVTIATTGNEALEKMHKDAPHLLLIDLVLRGKSGYDVLTEKTLDRMLTKIPVIIISNRGATIEMKRIPSTPSIKEYIIKSHVDPEEVVQKVSGIFGRQYIPKTLSNGIDDASLVNKSKNQKKILLVEDDKFLSQILFKKFESFGYTVLRATDGDQALHIVENTTPDIVILDILLPGISGFDVLQKMKTNPRLHSVPIIMLSNLSKPSDIEKAKTLGAQKFLLKAAVSLDEIMKEVESLLKI